MGNSRRGGERRTVSHVQHLSFETSTQTACTPTIIDAIRALCGVTSNADESIRLSDESLDMGRIR